MVFESMGCEIVVEGATAEEAARVRALFEDRDAVFSRFRPDSELNRVNASRGATLVSSLFARMVELALRARTSTGGLVDPTLGVEAAGYDRDFAELVPRDEPVASALTGPIALYGRVLVASRLDLNGVVKAAAVDDALRLVSGPGFVSAGGDLVTSAPVDVRLSDGGSVRLVSGGLATSGRTKRRWLRAGEEQHHLIDPATGRPAELGPLAATVVAGDAAEAEAHATALAVSPAAEARGYVAQRPWLAAVIVPGSGPVIEVGSPRGGVPTLVEGVPA